MLLIEDEESVRNTARIMISRLGYKVLEAKDGIEALSLFQEHQNEIDCVLSDTGNFLREFDKVYQYKHCTDGFSIFYSTINFEL